MRNVFIGMVFGVLLAIPLTGLTANSDTYRQLDLFGDVFERVHTDYVTEVEDKELIEAAINGMLASLDPHSSYLSPNHFNDMQEQTRGEFGGLGDGAKGGDHSAAAPTGFGAAIGGHMVFHGAAVTGQEEAALRQNGVAQLN